MLAAPKPPSGSIPKTKFQPQRCTSFSNCCGVRGAAQLQAPRKLYRPRKKRKRSSRIRFPPCRFRTAACSAPIEAPLAPLLATSIPCLACRNLRISLRSSRSQLPSSDCREPSVLLRASISADCVPRCRRAVFIFGASATRSTFLRRPDSFLSHRFQQFSQHENRRSR